MTRLSLALRTSFFRKTLILAGLAFLAQAAWAHPHMWIRGSLDPVFGPRGLEAVDVRWEFDDFNSAAFIRDFDSDGNGLFDSREIENARRESFDRQMEREYYLIVDVDGLRGTPMSAVDFRMHIDDGRLVYSFRVPLEITIRWEDMSRVGLFLFDASYFIDFRSVGDEVLDIEWEGRRIRFSPTQRELSTQGYGTVRVSGLQAGYDESSTARRLTISSRIKDRSFLLQERLASLTRRVMEGDDSRAFWTALGIAFLFGLIHVMGPGHGKAFTFAYFSSRRARLGEGLALSALINLLDSLSAFLLVGITYGILSLTIQSTGAVVGRISRITAYAVVAAVGFGHVLAHFIGKHGHQDERTALRPWMLALTVGLIPCPVSSALLSYGMAEGVLGFSILLVLGVSLGGMTALTAYSLIIIGGKAGITNLFSRRGFERALEWFELGSMVLLGGLGTVLLIGILSSP